MKKLIYLCNQKISKSIAVMLASFLSVQSSFAKLPKIDPPSNGEGKGIFETIKNYGIDGFELAGLVIAAIVFIVVAIGLIEGFVDVKNSKKKLGDLGLLALVGVLVIVFVIWLLTKGTTVL